MTRSSEDKKNGNIPQFDLYRGACGRRSGKSRTAVVSRLLSVRSASRNLTWTQTPCASATVLSRVGSPDGRPRTLQKVCGGKAFRSRGWKPYIDLVRTFKRNTPGTWLLQHECKDGQDENSYIQDWSLPNYGLRHYEPHPMYGPIYSGVDWGSTHPACVLWFQYLTAEVPALGFEYEPIWLSAGLYVCFRELYVAGIGSDTLAKRVVAIENEYRHEYGQGWKVKGRFCDPQGAGDRIIFANHGLPSSWPIKTRNKIRFIETVQNLVIDDRFAVDVDKAPTFCEEVEGWQRDPRTGKELDKFNHAMAAWRYGISNAEALESKRREMMKKMAKARQKGKRSLVHSHSRP